MEARVPANLLRALESYGGTARLVGPEMAFDSAPMQKGGGGAPRLVGWTLVVALASTSSAVEVIHEIGRTIQTAIEHAGISTVSIEVGTIKVRVTGRQAGLKAAAALEEALAKQAKAAR